MATLTCPDCRALHPQTCGTRIFVHGLCNICLDAKSPLVLLPCHHGYCEECFASLGGAILETRAKNGPVECTWAQAHELKEAGSDAGSGARMDLKYYEYLNDGWLMLGHSDGSGRMLVAKEGPCVRKAISWKRVWNDKGSWHSRDYDIYVPECGDKNFCALGVVCVFRSSGHAKPRLGMPVACVHRDCCEPATLGTVAWSDAGSSAKHDVTLNRVPDTGVMWPSKLSMVRVEQAYRLKTEFMPCALAC